MFVRLFGETEKDQLKYLQPRVILTAVWFVVMIAGIITRLELLGAAMGILGLVVFFSWGWAPTKTMLGVGSIGAIFSGNVVFGVVIFVICIMLAYIAGLICGGIGIFRYIYLRIKASKGLI